ncbi:MAG: YncE family protein [Deltaproteobacteria bacterium]
MKRIAIILAVFLPLWGCQAKKSLVRPALEDDGAIYLYIAPLSQEAGRLSFRIGGISALREDGAEFPMVLSLTDVNRIEVTKERMIASGTLPPGRYAGIAFKIESASLKGEEGEAVVLVPSEATRTVIPFTVGRKRGTVLKLSYRYQDSLHGGFRISPVFDIDIPGKIPSGLIGYASSRDSNTVTIFDKLTGHVISVVPTGTAPSGLALDRRKAKLYVALSGEDAVEVIDVLTGEVDNRLHLAGGDYPRELALTPDGGKLLSVNVGSNTVSVINTASLIEVLRINVGKGPESLQIDQNGRRAYILNRLSNSVSVIDLPSQQVAATISTDSEPVSGGFNRDGSRFYVAHRSSPYLYVINPFSFSIINKIRVGTGATALKVDHQNNWIYLARQHTGKIDIYDPFSFLPIDFIAVPGEVAFMAIDGEGNSLFLVLPGEKTVKGIRLVSKEAFAEIEVGEEPFRVTIMGER